MVYFGFQEETTANTADLKDELLQRENLRKQP